MLNEVAGDPLLNNKNARGQFLKPNPYFKFMTAAGAFNCMLPGLSRQAKHSMAVWAFAEAMSSDFFDTADGQ
jgi:hypothetical protein